jgi:N-sulfoglucosamine sulfohydrolase
VGFYGPSKPSYVPLPELLRQHGYGLGIMGKVEDMMPMNHYKWDVTTKSLGKKKLSARKPEDVYAFAKGAMTWFKEKNQPFYLNINLVDPHKPFYGSPKDQNNPKPSKVFEASDIVVPDFLPDLPDIRQELAQYYSSVRRADDALGRVMDALREEGLIENTIVMLVSDHGMPLPFAKTNLYHHSTHTPWLVSFPPLIQPGQVDEEHMVSAIDFYPTICELLGVTPKHELDGQSVVPLLKGKKQAGRSEVYKEYHENAGATPLPMRSIQDRRFVYIFNPWHYGTATFKSATLYTATYRAMNKSKDKAIRQRRDLFLRRPLEEFYDVLKDPSCINNLAESMEYKRIKERMRNKLLAHMEEHGDPASEALKNMDQPAYVKAWIQKMQDQSKAAWADPTMDKKRSPKGLKSR